MIAPGTELGPYTVLDKLGAGGMGDVYLARDNRLGREVALKMLPRPFARDPQRLGLFRREALTLAALNHPHIATIHGFEEPEPGTLFLVLERVEGETLAQRLARGPLAVGEALAVCAKVAEALEVAHERGIVHRDLKPGNVMLGPRGVVKVLDFGLARSGETPSSRASGAPAPAAWDGEATLAGGTPSAQGWDGEATLASTGAADLGAGSGSSSEDDEVAGTPGYMSPEQIRAEPQDARADIFSFGCVLYECLAGRRAFSGTSLLEVFDATLTREPDRSLLPAAVPARIRELLDRCLVKAVDGRLAEIRAARIAIEEVLGIRRASALRTGEEVPTVANNLPRNLTTFVGRERETGECLRLIGEARLVTLTGVGGSGKTRLAVQIATRLLPEFPDGVWFADLAAVNEPERVVTTVALALGLREEPGKTIRETLLEHLSHRRALIVLDTCEHLVAAAAELVTLLLASCPDLRLLATSREALGVTGEIPFAVPTLRLPAEGAADPESLRGFESVRLFLDRAAQVKAGFDLDASNAAAVAEICRRLDGIPLAIELAAARVKVLSVEQIRGKLDDRFRLLTGGSRTALPRQQTLLAAIQWSYDHLAELEQRLLRCLSVFAGGWTLESAVAAWEEGADEFEVLDLLTRLVDKSLVVVEASGDSARYHYLDTVRQYARERLAEAGEGAPVSGRHLDYFLALVETAERELVGPAQKEWFARLDLEHANLLAALAWCRADTMNVEKGLRLAAAAARYWSGRGTYDLGRTALDQALRADVGAKPSTARASALVRLGGMALYQGDYAAARGPIEESLAVYRALDDAKGVARALSGLATVATYQRDYASARAYGQEILARYQASGDKRGAAVTEHNLGFLSLCEGDAEAAAEAYRRSLALLGEIGDLKHTALTLVGLGVASARAGDLEAATGSLAGGIEIALEVGAKREGADALEGVAEIAVRLGYLTPAARFFGVALALREEIGSAPAPAERETRDALLDQIRAGLGEVVLEQEITAGRTLDFGAGLESAAAWLATLPPTPAP